MNVKVKQAETSIHQKNVHDLFMEVIVHHEVTFSFFWKFKHNVIISYAELSDSSICITLWMQLEWRKTFCKLKKINHNCV